MRVTISRFNPEKDLEPHLETYDVSVSEGARVLNVLDAVHDTIDASLGYRHCCRGGQCGSCAVRVNGEPALACMHEAKEGDIIEPLNLPRIRDLIVDIAPAIAQMAWLNTGSCLECSHVTTDDIEEIKPLRECIECFSCISSCPAVGASSYAGPTAIRQQQRLNLDPRDKADHIEEAVSKGLFSCTTCHKCVEVCPKEIETPRKAVEKLRALAVARGLSLPAHKALAALIESTGRSVERNEPTFIERVADVIEPEGRLSLNSKMGEVLHTFRGKLIFMGLIKKVMGGKKTGKKKGGMKAMGFEITPDMMSMMNGFTVLRLFTLMGGMMNVNFTKEELLELNKKLNRIRQPRK